MLIYWAVSLVYACFCNNLQIEADGGRHEEASKSLVDELISSQTTINTQCFEILFYADDITHTRSTTLYCFYFCIFVSQCSHSRQLWRRHGQNKKMKMKEKKTVIQALGLVVVKGWHMVLHYCVYVI